MFFKQRSDLLALSRGAFTHNAYGTGPNVPRDAG
jgi:hypothetical protein